MSEIRLLTFNTWGLKYISKHRRERLRALADDLADENDGHVYDIVALQEVWTDEDWNYINETCTNYPYRRQFKSGIIAGPGLAILSKLPITESFLYRFPINGRASAFFRGDWYVGKSIAVTLLKSDTVPIAILNSHMHAPYGPLNSYSTHRACQAWDFTKLVKLLKKAGYAVIQVGDLNSTPGSLPHRLFTIEGGLQDSWDLCKSDQFDISLLSPKDQITVAGVTCDSQLNTWRSDRAIHEACRLDYALVDSDLLSPSNPKVVFTSILPPPLNCSYSDHFAYSVTLTPKLVSELNSSISDEDKSLVHIDLLTEIDQYRKHTIPFQANWRRNHFILSIITLILIHILSFKFGLRNSFLAGFTLLVSLIIAVTGSLNGLIWFLGVRSEDRALNEVELEVKDSLNSLKSI